MKNIPDNYELYVKEHPTQGTARGWRDISFYQKIMKYKKVKFFHPSFDSKTLLQNCKLVISVGGTSSFEAAFFGKPSIIFADLGYSLIPSIKKLNNYYELKQEIPDSLNVRVNPNHVYNYIKILEENSFDFDILNFEQSYHNWFFLNGNLVDVNIDVEKMKQFLLHHENDLKYVSSEFMKKINASSDSK